MNHSGSEQLLGGRTGKFAKYYKGIWQVFKSLFDMLKHSKYGHSDLTTSKLVKKALKPELATEV